MLIYIFAIFFWFGLLTLAASVVWGLGAWLFRRKPSERDRYIQEMKDAGDKIRRGLDARDKIEARTKTLPVIEDYTRNRLQDLTKRVFFLERAQACDDEHLTRFFKKHAAELREILR